MNSLNGSIHHLDPQTKDENAFVAQPFVGTEHIGYSTAPSASGTVGSDLTAADYAALESRWIDRALADRAGLRRVDSLTGGEVIGRKSGNYAGIIIPYHHPGSDHIRDYRLRRDQPDLEYDSAGNLKQRQKYLSPPGRSNMLYLVPGVSQVLLRDASLPIMITEGEFKTLALWRLANHGSPAGPDSCRSAFPVSTTGAERSAKPSGRTAVGWT